MKTEAGVPQASGRAYTRVLLIGNCVSFENMAAQTQSTTAGLPTEVFTSPQQVLEGWLDLLPGDTKSRQSARPANNAEQSTGGGAEPEKVAPAAPASARRTRMHAAVVAPPVRAMAALVGAVCA